MVASGGTKAVVAAVAANLTLAVPQFTAWTRTRSSSMPAEAIDAAGSPIRPAVPTAAVIGPGPGIHPATREADVAAPAAAVA
ncbi:MAG: hypothetical protein ABWX68_11265 [Arthrobacter sp.]|uniref:hypothetical protein n=1 Tax=Arthrobacter sp. TaxID=1667 RepID=UPI003470DE0E